MDDLNQRKSSEQVTANVSFNVYLQSISIHALKEQINRAYEAENCEDEKTKHLSEVNLENLSGKQRREKVCPGERKTSPPKCLLFHAFFRIAYIATNRWMNNKCMFALPSFLTTYFATNRWVGRAYKEESPVEERRQNCSTNRGKNIMMMPTAFQ